MRTILSVLTISCALAGLLWPDPPAPTPAVYDHGSSEACWSCSEPIGCLAWDTSQDPIRHVVMGYGTILCRSSQPYVIDWNFSEGWRRLPQPKRGKR